jgi:hypothetical protein
MEAGIIRMVIHRGRPEHSNQKRVGFLTLPSQLGNVECNFSRAILILFTYY